jgi:hypothetical protein
MMGKLGGRNRWRAISQWNAYNFFFPMSLGNLKELAMNHFSIILAIVLQVVVRTLTHRLFAPFKVLFAPSYLPP